jgi:hypothetical protein
MRRGMAMVVRATDAAGLGTGAERLINDGLDGPRTPTALGAAAETAVQLLGVTWKVFRTLDGTADVVVAKYVAGTNDHLS